MRLIDAGSFIQRLEHEAYSRNRIELLRARDVVNETPTVDAVPVIRCKDCKHYTGYECQRSKVSNIRVITNDDDYCSRAERKEHETN